MKTNSERKNTVENKRRLKTSGNRQAEEKVSNTEITVAAKIAEEEEMTASIENHKIASNQETTEMKICKETEE